MPPNDYGLAAVVDGGESQKTMLSIHTSASCHAKAHLFFLPM